jgi:hypothetical protein
MGASLARGLDHAPAGVLVTAWPAVAPAGSFEFLMLLNRSGHQPSAERFCETPTSPRRARSPLADKRARLAITDSHMSRRLIRCVPALRELADRCGLTDRGLQRHRRLLRFGR